MTIQQMQHRLNTFVMRGERAVGEVVSDWRSYAVLSTAVLGFVVAQNWEGLKQTMSTWFTPDEVSPRATMMALIPTVKSQEMFVPKSIDPVPMSRATETAASIPTFTPEPIRTPNQNIVVVKPMDGYVWNGDGASFSVLSPDMSLDHFGTGEGERYTFELAPTKIFLGEDKRMYVQGRGYNGNEVLIPATGVYLFDRKTYTSKEVKPGDITKLLIPQEWTVIFQIYPNGDTKLTQAKVAQILATNQFGDSLLRDKRILAVLGSRP